MRVEAVGTRLRAIGLPDSRFYVAATAGDECHRVQVEKDRYSQFVLTTSGTRRDLGWERPSLARVGPNRFWVVTPDASGRPVILSLEP